MYIMPCIVYPWGAPRCMLLFVVCYRWFPSLVYDVCVCVVSYVFVVSLCCSCCYVSYVVCRHCIICNHWFVCIIARLLCCYPRGALFALKSISLSLSLYIYIYIHTRMYIHIHIHICIYIYIYIYIHGALLGGAVDLAPTRGVAVLDLTIIIIIIITIPTSD